MSLFRCLVLFQMGAKEGGTSLSLKESFHYLPPERDVQETARGSKPAAKPGLCPATRLTKEPFMRGDNVNSAISRGKEKRAEGRLLPPAVASGGPSPVSSLTLSAEPKEKVGKEPVGILKIKIPIPLTPRGSQAHDPIAS